MITDMRDELLVERYRTLLFEVSEAIATHRDLTALFRDLARRLPAVVPFEFIALFLHDPDRNVMRIHMLGNADADSIPPGMEIPVDGSFSGRVFTTQQPAIVARPEEAERFPTASSLMQTNRDCIVLHAAADDDVAAAWARLDSEARARTHLTSRKSSFSGTSRRRSRSRWTTCCTMRRSAPPSSS